MASSQCSSAKQMTPNDCCVPHPSPNLTGSVSCCKASYKNQKPKTHRLQLDQLPTEMFPQLTGLPSIAAHLKGREMGGKDGKREEMNGISHLPAEIK